MPKNTLGELPFPPLHVLDHDGPIQAVQIQKILAERENAAEISLLLRSEDGHPKRGGYYFHFKRSDSGNMYDLYDFQKRQVASVNENDLVLLINHCSGRAYSHQSYELCQNEINLRDDL